MQRSRTVTRTGAEAAAEAEGQPEGFGALYNGMVLPWVNYTIAGVTWYQGENNVFQCAPAGPGDPHACGSAAHGVPAQRR